MKSKARLHEMIARSLTNARFQGAWGPALRMAPGATRAEAQEVKARAKEALESKSRLLSEAAHAKGWMKCCMPMMEEAQLRCSQPSAQLTGTLSGEELLTEMTRFTAAQLAFAMTKVTVSALLAGLQ